MNRLCNQGSCDLLLFLHMECILCHDLTRSSFSVASAKTKRKPPVSVCQSKQEQVAREGRKVLQLTLLDLRRPMLDRLLVRLDGVVLPPETFQRLAPPDVTFCPVGRYPYCGLGVGEGCFIVGRGGTQDGEGSVPEEDKMIGLCTASRMVSELFPRLGNKAPISSENAQPAPVRPSTCPARRQSRRL